MALTFPIAMPANGAAGEYFEPERIDFQSARVDGRVNGVTAGPALWRARWTLGGSISRETSEQWRAFVAALRGQQRTFLGGDQGRPYPLGAPNGFASMTRAGGGTWDGTATSWALNTDRDVVTLNNLKALFPIYVGDLFMYRWTTGGVARRSLHRAVEAATANASGNVAFTIEPPVPTLVPGGAVADLARPTAVFRLTSETKLGEKGRALRIGGTIDAIQDLRP